jgi:hypothetical protein
MAFYTTVICLHGLQVCSKAEWLSEQLAFQAPWSWELGSWRYRNGGEPILE